MRRVRVAGVPTGRWRDAAERVYGEVGVSRVLRAVEIAGYMALTVEAAEGTHLDIITGMACGLQEYVEGREAAKADLLGGRS